MIDSSVMELGDFLSWKGATGREQQGRFMGLENVAGKAWVHARDDYGRKWFFSADQLTEWEPLTP